jgi:hypothetical protein
MGEINADWPDDDDGDVFRLLKEHGFDFAKFHTIDFDVDFPRWPPSAEAVLQLEATYGSVQLYGPEDDDLGHVQFKIHGRLSYENVTSVQRQASSAMAEYGGVCETWGVLKDAL